MNDPLSLPIESPAAKRGGNTAAVLLFLCAMLAVAVAVASMSGSVAVSPASVARALAGGADAADTLAYNVLINVRLPRVVFAMLAGAALALTGAVMQALFRNPLAEPGLIGISAGGALGAVSAIVFSAGGFWMLAPAAFAGSLIATALAYAIGQRVPGVAGLLLAGVAINAIAGSLIGLVTVLASNAQLRDLTFWTLGSLDSASWPLLAFLGPWTLVWTVGLLRQWRLMNALLLGEREAHHLGFQLTLVRRRLIIVTALLVGPLVAACGGIAFVGLVVPHLVRLSLGANQRALLPATVLAGALALTLADWLTRVAIEPAELPIGLVTSLVGGPFFIWLLVRREGA